MQRQEELNGFDLLTDDLWGKLFPLLTIPEILVFKESKYIIKALKFTNQFYYAVGVPIYLYKPSFPFISWFFPSPSHTTRTIKAPDQDEITQSLFENDQVCVFANLSDAQAYCKTQMAWEHCRAYDYYNCLTMPAVFVVSLKNTLSLREQICDRKTHDSAPIPKTQPDPIRYFLTAKSNLREPHFAQFNVYKEKHLSLFAVKSKKFDDDFISWWNDILNQNLDQLDQFLFIKMKNFFNTYDNSFFSIRHCQLQVNAILTFLEGKPNAAAILKCLKEKREEVRTPEFNQNGRYCRMLDFIIGKLTNLNCLKSQLPQFNEFLARR